MKVIARALALLVLTLTLVPIAAQATEPESVVVRNRKYLTDGKFELSANAGFTMVNYLTSHTNLTAAVAYNITDNWALEVEGGYALSGHTSVADAASATIVASNPAVSSKQVDDFSNLWQMSWNAMLNLRWTPIYGKLNIAGELPVHFQFYLFIGGGAGGFVRDSLVYCYGQRIANQAMTCAARPDPTSSTELQALEDKAIKPIIGGGAGMKFFIAQWVGLRVEIKDMSFPDSYLVNIDRSAAEADTSGSGSAGTPATNPGFTNLVLAEVGLVFTF